MVTKIPSSEFKLRIQKLQKKLVENDYDAYLVHANEADFANVRYLTDHWPLFESSGVLVPKEGEPILLIGPEAPGYAAESNIKKIRLMEEYRHSVEPDWPNIDTISFSEIFDEISNGKELRRLALGNYTILPMHLYDSIKKTLGNKGEIIRAEWIIEEMRIVKSKNEVALMRNANHICELVLEDTIKSIRPDMTEMECEGIITEAMYRYGAEGPAFPIFVFGGERTRNLMGRTTRNKLMKRKMIQLNFGVRYGGYSSAIGRPLVFGKMNEEMKKHILFGLDAHRKVYDWIKAGVSAKKVYFNFFEYYKNHGYGSAIVSGAGHGVGIMECEKPFIRFKEQTPDYSFKKNMTFMADNYFLTDEYGFRWEDGFRVTEEGCEVFSNLLSEIIEL